MESSVGVVVNHRNHDGGAALRAAAVLNSMTPARLAEILCAADGSVSSIGTASVEVKYGQPEETPTRGEPGLGGLLDSGPSSQTTADEGSMIGGIIGGAVFILIVLALLYVYFKKRDEKQAAKDWLKSEKTNVAAPTIVTETPGELPKPTSPKPTSPGSPKASLKEADEDEEANFSGDDDEPGSPGSPKSPNQIFV